MSKCVVILEEAEGETLVVKQQTGLNIEAVLIRGEVGSVWGPDPRFLQHIWWRALTEC